MLLKWGIIGAGKISHDFAVSLSILPAEKHKIVAIASRNLQRAEKFANEHDIEKYYVSYEELLLETKVDVVYIAVINTLHFEIAKLALEHGKHVLCEKPMCVSAKETRELVEFARKRRLFLMEGLWSRFLPSYEKLKDELDAGSIGSVLQVLASFGTPCENIERIRLGSLGGGSVLDRGCYCIQLASLVFGGEKPEQILSGGHMNSDDAETSSSTTLIYSEGRTATLLTHCQVNLPNEAYIIGTKGTIKSSAAPGVAILHTLIKMMKLISAPFWKTTKLETPKAEFAFTMPKADKPTIFWNSTGFSYQISEVRRCILNGLIESPGVSHAESILISEISDCIRVQILGNNDKSSMDHRFGSVHRSS